MNIWQISKEVWEWNSVVEDEDVPADQSTEAPVSQSQTTKAKQLLEEQEKTKEPQEKKERFSKLVSGNIHVQLLIALRDRQFIIHIRHGGYRPVHER